MEHSSTIQNSTRRCGIILVIEKTFLHKKGGANMNKNRLNRGIYISLATILMVNNFAALTPIKVSAEDITGKNTDIIENLSIAKNNIIDMNGDFEDTFKKHL